MSPTRRSRHRMRRVAAPRGFTLVELMVVLFILGMAGVAVVLTAPGRDPLQVQADALAEGLLRAREEAVLGTRAVEVTVTPQGYGYTRRRLDGWEPLVAAPFGNVAWPDGVRARMPDGREQVTFRFDPVGPASIERVVLEEGHATVRVSLDDAGRVRIDADAR